MTGFGAVLCLVVVVVMAIERYPVPSWLWLALIGLVALATLRELARS